MLDFIGTVATTTLMVFAVNAVIVFMDISRPAKLMLALVGGGWIGLAAAAGAAGMIAVSKPFPVVGIFCRFAARRGNDRNGLAGGTPSHDERANPAYDWPQYRSHLRGVVFPAGG